MDALISALLDISRIASRDLDRTHVDLDALMQRVADSFEFILQGRGIKLHVGKLPPARVDAVRIEQVFSNLVDNAIKYIGDGREISVGAVGGPLARYFVRDSGMGMTAGELKKVFRLFRRGRASDIPGEGIGLTLVRKVIERHGGRIWVESRAPPCGSRWRRPRAGCRPSEGEPAGGIAAAAGHAVSSPPRNAGSHGLCQAGRPFHR
jgi:signal transduction histidine kinase